MNALTTFPTIPAPPPAITRILSRFDRKQLAGFIAVAIDLLDVVDGDADIELNGDEHDYSQPHWAYRGDDGPVEYRDADIALAGMDDSDEDDDPAEDNGDERDGNGAEDDFMAHRGDGPGCPLADADEAAWVETEGASARGHLTIHGEDAEPEDAPAAMDRIEVGERSAGR